MTIDISVDSRIPSQVNSLLERYVDAIISEFGFPVAIYLHGSIALEAFDEATSDIDFVTVLRQSPTDGALRKLEAIHREDAAARALEGVYASQKALSDGHLSITLPYFKGGRHRSDARIPADTRMLLRRRGVVVRGPDPASLIPEVSRAELDHEMAFNLNTYWLGRASRPHLFLAEPMVESAVLALPRIIRTLETGDIISKPAAAAYLESSFPQWAFLVDWVRGRTADPSESRGPLRRIRRAADAIRFIRFMVRHAREKYPAVRELSATSGKAG